MRHGEILDEIARLIAINGIGARQSVPSIPQWSKRLNVSDKTVRKANGPFWEKPDRLVDTGGAYPELLSVGPLSPQRFAEQGAPFRKRGKNIGITRACG